MPVRKRQQKRRVPRKVKMARKMRSSGVPDVASLSESIQRTISSQQLSGFATSYNALSLSYVDFKRAQGVAQYYQFFRIKRVTYIYKPTFDTYAPGGLNTMPYLYWSINKTGENQLLDQPAMISRGAKSIRLDDKNITVTYTPTVGTQNTSINAIANNSGSYLTSPWLTTDDQTNLASWTPSTVQHFGHYAMVTCIAPMQFDVQMIVEFEFKKPRVSPVSNNTGVPEDEFFKPAIAV